MSCVNTNYSGFNFSAANLAAQDCFLMQKINLSYSTNFGETTLTFILEEITNPSHLIPLAPYTFLSAQSEAEYATVGEINQISHNATDNTYTYRVMITIPTKLAFTDANGLTFFACGYVNIFVQFTTHFTYEELCYAGKAIALVCFRSISGQFVNPETFQITIRGKLQIMFISPSTIRVSHDGECSFLPAPKESISVVS